VHASPLFEEDGKQQHKKQQPANADARHAAKLQAK
jgi:hypothetical protein